MKCYIHPDMPANVRCVCCDEPICGTCIIHTSGAVFCRGCLARRRPVSHKKRPAANLGLLALFAFFLPPGAGYMYLGLIKRGLSAMICFFFLAFLFASGLSGPFLFLVAASIVAGYFACIFDSFHIWRRMNGGEEVEDEPLFMKKKRKK